MALIDDLLEQMETHRMVTPTGIFLRKDDVRNVLQQVLDHYAPGDTTTDTVTVDWNEAPEWANFWAMDYDGLANWFKHRPVPFCNRWCSEHDQHGHEKHQKFKGPFYDWKQNFRSRPGKNVPPLTEYR